MPRPTQTSNSTSESNHEPDLIDKKELRRRLNLPSVRMVEELMRKRKIPYLRLGHRTIRFSWSKVLEAISKFERRAIGSPSRIEVNRD